MSKSSFYCALLEKLSICWIPKLSMHKDNLENKLHNQQTNFNQLNLNKSINSNSKACLKHLLCYDVLIVITQSCYICQIVIVVAHLDAVFIIVSNVTWRWSWWFENCVNFVLLMNLLGIFFQGTRIFWWDDWRVIGIDLVTEWYRRPKTMFRIIEWHVCRWHSWKTFGRRLFWVRWIQVDWTSLSWFRPCPRRCSAAFWGGVIWRWSRRRIFRRRYKRFVFGGRFETRIPILK